jgi:hypothetical protein
MAAACFGFATFCFLSGVWSRLLGAVTALAWFALCFMAYQAWRSAVSAKRAAERRANEADVAVVRLQDRLAVAEKGWAEAEARNLTVKRAATKDDDELREMAGILWTTGKARELASVFEDIPKNAKPPEGVWRSRYEYRLRELLRSDSKFPAASAEKYRNLFEELDRRYVMLTPASDHEECIDLLRSAVVDDERRYKKILESRSRRLTDLISAHREGEQGP